jgi:hypothetical protein
VKDNRSKSLKNIINQKDRTLEERKRIASMGGKKCAENKRKRANIKERMKILMENNYTLTAKEKKQFKNLGFDEKDTDVMDKLVVSVFMEAFANKHNSLEAIKYILDMTGQGLHNEENEQVSIVIKGFNDLKE